MWSLGTLHIGGALQASGDESAGPSIHGSVTAQAWDALSQLSKTSSPGLFFHLSLMAWV